jgi:hypothetical protein
LIFYDIIIRVINPVTGSAAGGYERNHLTFALVINGHALAHALEPKLEDMLMGVAEHCSAGM